MRRETELLLLTAGEGPTWGELLEGLETATKAQLGGEKYGVSRHHILWAAYREAQDALLDTVDGVRRRWAAEAE